jgi:hypothetical protein
MQAGTRYRSSFLPLCLLPLVLFSLPAPSQDFGLSIKVGTPGLETDLTLPVAGAVNARAILAWAQVPGDWTEGSNSYEGKARLWSVGLLFDVHPGGGGFRISAGAVYSDNRVEATADAATYVVNGVPYLSADVGTLSALVKGNTVWPYLGIGWGNPLVRNSTWKLAVDAGAYYVGSPRVTMNANPTKPGQLPPGFEADLEQERQKIEQDLSGKRFYPVLSVGFSYSF